MLWTPGTAFHAKFSNQSVASANPGTSITPGNNTFPAYAEILSDTVVTEDCYGILININSNAVSAAARDTLVNIGADPAGGTSFSTIIADLMGSCAGAMNAGGGMMYYFPLYIKNGTALAAQASVNNATVGTLRVWVTLFAKPQRPDLLKVGSYVTAVGAVEASSRGTTVTPGASGAEGSYASLGTPTKDHWWWQSGIGVNDGTMNALSLFADIAAGDATNKVLLQENNPFHSTSAEAINGGYNNLNPLVCYHEVPGSTEIWGRISNSGANDAAYSMMAYGLGG